MKPQNDHDEELIKYAASHGIRLTIDKEPSDIIYFPEQVKMAEEIFSKITPAQIEELFKDTDD